jgi:hypothetical protein
MSEDKVRKILHLLLEEPYEDALIASLFSLYKRENKLNLALLELDEKAQEMCSFFSRDTNYTVDYVCHYPRYISFIKTSKVDDKKYLYKYDSYTEQGKMSNNKLATRKFRDPAGNFIGPINNLTSIYQIPFKELGLTIIENMNFKYFNSEIHRINISKCRNLNYKSLSETYNKNLRFLCITDCDNQILDVKPFVDYFKNNEPIINQYYLEGCKSYSHINNYKHTGFYLYLSNICCDIDLIHLTDLTTYPVPIEIRIEVKSKSKKISQKLSDIKNQFTNSKVILHLNNV